MECFSMLQGYKKRGGGWTASPLDGYKDLRLDVPCGQCVGCRINRSRMWALRCVHESSLHERNSFITLTYKDLPEYGSLNIRDWQLFVKRMRFGGIAFRYFMCGEYGDLGRPHYHAIIFGEDFSSDRILIRKKPHALYVSETLSSYWGLGHVVIGECNLTTAAYCAKYIMDKKTGYQSELHYVRWDAETGEAIYLKPEFAAMSRRPGLGTGWFEKYGSDVFPSDEVVVEGKKFRPPRFYDLKLADDTLIAVKKARRARVAASPPDLSPVRLATRERIELAKQKFFGRKL